MSSHPTRAPDTAVSRQDILVIDGMFCAACAASVEATLKKQAGVTDASVNFAADAAVLQWSGQNADDIRLAIKALGYDARFVGDDTKIVKNPADPARRMMLRLIIAIFFGMWTMLPSIALYLGIGDPATAHRLALAAGLFSIPVIAYSGVPFYRMGWTTLRAGVAGIDALILLGVAGSLILSGLSLSQGDSEVYFEVPVALITLQLVARLLDLRVRRRARDTVLQILELAPATLTLIDDRGDERSVVLSDARIGAKALIRPGSRVAIDGCVISGRAEVDRSLFSGESAPMLVGPGQIIHAGEQLLNGALTVEISAITGKRRIDQLARQVRKSLAQKPAWQRIVDTAARHFLWAAAVAAVVAAIGVTMFGGDSTAAAVRALAVFVIACPCALSLAAPLAALSASAAAARRGIIIRDMNAATNAATPGYLFVDKTGTLTLGRPLIRQIHAMPDSDETQVLATAATAERLSEHPIAKAILSAAGHCAANSATASTKVVPGSGIEWRDDQDRIIVGRLGWIQDAGIEVPVFPETDATRVGVALNDRLIGAIDLDDPLRDDALSTICRLKELGIETMILSGDAEKPVAHIAAQLGVRYHTRQSPEDKVKHIEAMRSRGVVTAFAGDGINDGPALAAADLGIAIDGATDAARTAAAVSFVEASIAEIPYLLRLTRCTRRIIKQNLVWAIVYNAIAIPAAMLGWIHPAIAATAMALSSITIMLNATRAK